MTKRNRSSRTRSGGRSSGSSLAPFGLSGLMDEMRQGAYPSEWRIEPAVTVALPRKPVAEVREDSSKGRKNSREDRQSALTAAALAEVATCFWYLKTKHFKKEWQNEDTADDDPRTRRTLGRLNKGVDAIKKCGIEVVDPTGKRYPSGGEAMMRPLDFVPTDGITFETVTEAVLPMVYWNGHLVQRAEVFVAVPRQGSPNIAQESSGKVNENPLAGSTISENPAPAEKGEQA